MGIKLEPKRKKSLLPMYRKWPSDGKKDTIQKLSTVSGEKFYPTERVLSTLVIFFCISSFGGRLEDAISRAEPIFPFHPIQTFYFSYDQF